MSDATDCRLKRGGFWWAADSLVSEAFDKRLDRVLRRRPEPTAGEAGSIDALRDVPGATGGFPLSCSSNPSAGPRLADRVLRPVEPVWSDFDAEATDTPVLLRFLVAGVALVRGLASDSFLSFVFSRMTYGRPLSNSLKGDNGRCSILLLHG